MAAARSRLVAELTRIAGGTSALVGLSVVPLLGSRDLEHAAIAINPHGRRRFPMASTAKVPLALTVLRLVDSGALVLDQRLQLGLDDVRPGTGVLAQQLVSGGTAGTPVAHTVEQLLELALNDSDNCATDALLALVGGPEAVQADLERLGLGQETHITRTFLELIRDRCGCAHIPAPASSSSGGGGDGGDAPPLSAVELTALLEGRMEVLPLR